MGTWSTSILGNDTSADIYQDFYARYNEGENPVVVAESLKREYGVGGHSFEGDDEWIDLLFGFALAQWETKCLDRDTLQAVEAIIESKEDLERWGEPDSDMVKERSIVLKDFLAQISVERPKAKRRSRPKHDFSVVEITRIVSPDGEKEFTLSEEFVNGNYIHTSGLMERVRLGAYSGIVYYEWHGMRASARWIDSQHLEITHEPGVDFSKKEETDYFCGNVIRISYREEPPMGSGD
jgi:hypothetical protein